MAKCDLSIELDGDPSEVRYGGGTISGVVRVNADKDVNCNGLVVESGWYTHGQGNIAAGTFASEVLFTGQWQAGQTAEYRFELPIGHWPPSYHGHYLNVDHAVSARAKIPWGFDPKASESFLMQPTCGPEGAELPVEKKNAGVVGGIFAAIILLGFIAGCGAIAIANPFLLVVFVIVVSAIAIFGFVKVVLPMILLGNVECELTKTSVTPGQQVEGELVVRPRRNVSINAITMNFTAREECVSGSGSNRTTHTKVFIDDATTLEAATTLPAGQEHRFPISVVMPADAPYSLDLDDNELEWSASLRVDIPRWPDWTKKLPIRVVPSGEPTARTPTMMTSAPATSVAEVNEPEPDVGITFAETVNHLWALRGEQDQIDALVDAVSGLTFDIEAHVERRLLYSGEEDPHVYADGYAIWAKYSDPELPMVLYVPHDLADEFEQIGRDLWRGRGTIVGWDHQHRRLQVKLQSGGS